MKHLLLLLFTFLTLGSAYAQNHSCGFDEGMNHLRTHTPQGQTQESAFNQNLRTVLNSPAFKSSTADYTIPVVFHILHDPADSIPVAGTSNPTDSMVHQGLRFLNESFRNLEPYDTTQGVDVKIEFCLAQQDTNGVYTTGITRHSGDTYIFSNNYGTFWNGANWDETRYLNIYIFSGGFLWGISVSGFSSFPSSHGNPGDGFAITHYTLTNPNSAGTIAHEAGHYLGLYHTFQGGCPNQDCQVDGDRVCDTPPDASSSYPTTCSDSINTCTSDTADLSLNNPFRPISMGGLGDQLDPIYNYMDYTRGECRRQFTQGQKDRMLASLTTTRASLLSSPACQSVCSDVIIADFATSLDTVIAGDTLFLTNSSINGTQYQWYIDGDSASTAADTSWVFAGEGYHQIVLAVSNDSVNCGVQAATQYVYVVCDITTTATASSLNVLPGESITFNGQAIGGTSYVWYLDGDSINNTLAFTHSFAEPGMYEIQLKSSNGICPDSSEVLRITVGKCTGGIDEKWVFGSNVGWDFSTGAVDDFEVQGINSTEGTASVADENGNLLFYTDGQTVWNAQLNQMPNGDNLANDINDVQPVQILPLPGDSNLYYIFSANYNPGNVTIVYGMVDMRLDSGRGDVISKQLLLEDEFFKSFSATKHANGCDYWFIARQAYPFEIRCYPVTANGIGAPVINSLPGGSGFGQLDVSPNGKLIAVSNATYIVVADFDNSTGLMSNPYNLTPIETFASAVAFSPGSNRLYVGGYTNSSNSDRLGQFDLTLGSPTAIQNSSQLISVPETKLRSLKRAPDGKIYGALEYRSYMAVIEFPNQLGAASNYSDQGTPSSMWGNSRQYLPNLVPTFGVRNELPLHGPNLTCAGAQNVEYRLTCSDSTVWTYSGSGSIDSISHTFLSIDFGTAGTDTLVVWSRSSCGPDLVDTLIIQVNAAQPFSLGNDITLCPADTIVLDVGTMFTVITWQNGMDSSAYQVDTAGLVWVDVMDSGGCVIRDSLDVVSFTDPAPAINLGVDTTICPGTSYSLIAGQNDLTYVWQNSSTDSSLIVNSAGLYHVTATDVCGQIGTDSIAIAVYVPPTISLQNDTTLCIGDSIQLVAPSGFTSYLWNDGSQVSSIYSNNAGANWVLAQDYCGNNSTDTMQLSFFPLPQVDLGNDTTICPGDSIELLVAGGYDTYLWNNGTQDSSAVVTSGGTNWVTVQDFCGETASDTINVSFSPLPQVEIGNDTTLCLGDSLLLDAAGNFTNYLWYDATMGSSIYAANPGTYWVQVTDACGLTDSDSMTVSADSPQGVELGNDTVLCAGDQIVLDAGAGFDTYLWQDNSTSASYTVNLPGTYFVSAINAAGCSYADTITIDPCVGVSESNSEFALTVFPNPTDGSFSIDLGDIYNTVTITITDLRGKIIQSETYYDSQLLELELNEAPGVYLLVIENAGWKSVVRLIKS